MVMSASGTCDYVAIVPDLIGDNGFECRAVLREPLTNAGNHIYSRLVGPAPLVRVYDAGLTPNAGPRRPWVLRSRITLTTPAQPAATVAEVSFHIDKALTGCVQPGDSINLSRTACGGLGLSIVRQNELVVAVGAVTAVPLGQGIEARIPLELIAAAEALFRQRDPDFESPMWPIEVSTIDARSVLYEGRRALGSYRIWVAHGFIDGIPGTNECAAICRTGGCPEEAAVASAMLLDDPEALSIARWYAGAV